VTSRGTELFWELYAALPTDIKTAARKSFARFREDQAHPSLHLERLRSDSRAWSVRVTLNYRAVAYRRGEDWVWIWIGNHRDFDKEFPT
jgi:plasmid maintenance system killer protein